MQYIYDGEYYKVVMISGPKHNMLGVKLSDTETDIEAVDIDSDFAEPRIHGDDVKSQVEVGLSEINDKLGKKYIISKIQYIGSDTRSNDVYIKLIKSLIEKIDCDYDFNKS